MFSTGTSGRKVRRGSFSRKLSRAIRPVIEMLEERRLLAVSIAPIDDISGTMNNRVDVYGTIANPGNTNLHRVRVQWGDGLSSLTSVYPDADFDYTADFNRWHSYSAIGTYTITVTAWDYTNPTDTATLTLSADISRVAPTIQLGAPTSRLTVGQTYSPTVILNDPSGNFIDSWTFNWGDGSNTVYTDPIPTASHVYTTAGDYTVSVTAHDSDFGNITVSNPTYDSSFGTDGAKLLDLGLDSGSGYYSWDFVNSMGQSFDGKVLVGGESLGNMAVSQHLDDGSLDPGFGSGGVAWVDFGGVYGATGNTMLVQEDGKILIAGHVGWVENNVSHTDFALARLDADGSLDEDFGTLGLIHTPFVGWDSRINALAVDPYSGTITAAGFAGSDLAVARYNADGTPDTSFNGTGQMSIDLGGFADIAYAVKIDPLGRIVLAGRSDADDFLLRYTSAGARDTTFGDDGDGDIVFDIGTNDHVYDIAFDDAGRILLVGDANGAAALIRRLDDGSPDTTFNGTGHVIDTDYPTSGQFFLSKLALDPDGRILAGGAKGYAMLLTRYNADGSKDTTFADGGGVTRTLSHGYDEAVALGVFNEGGQITAAFTGITYTGLHDFGLAQFLPSNVLTVLGIPPDITATYPIDAYTGVPLITEVTDGWIASFTPSGLVPDLDPDNYSAFVEWSDFSSDSAIIYANGDGTFDVHVDHTFGSSGSFTGLITVTHDPDGLTDTATVSVAVTDPEPPPPPVAPVQPTDLTASAISATQVGLVWKYDPNAESFTITRSGGAGTTYIDLDGSVANSYVDADVLPHTDYTYSIVARNQVGESPASASVSVRTLNTRPDLADDVQAGSVQSGDTLDIALSTLLSPGIDPDAADSLSVHPASISGSTAKGGSISLAGSTITYTPPGGFLGRDWFTYTITDGIDQSQAGTVFIWVEPDPGTDADQFVHIDPTGTTSIPIVSPFRENNPTVTAAPQHGSVSLSGDGLSYPYTPNGTFSGVDTYTYGITSLGTAAINVFSHDPTWFAGGANLPAGSYRVSYVTGAMRHENVPGAAFYRWDAVAVAATHSGGTGETNVDPNNYIGYDTEAEVYAARAGTSVTFTHSGGPIGVHTYDSPTGDNVAGSPPPTYLLEALSPVTHTVEVVAEPPTVTLTPHRTGLKFGDKVLSAVKRGNDPSKYVILTNNNYDEAHADGSMDFSDTTAMIGSDHDLARLDVEFPIGADEGTVTLSLSDPSAVRLFKSDGTVLSTSDLTVSLSSPSGYLANGGTIWIEGLLPNTDLTVSLVYKDVSNAEIARDDVHVNVVQWDFVRGDGQVVTPSTPVTMTGLGALHEAGTDLTITTVRTTMQLKNRLQGLFSDSQIKELRILDQSNLADFVIDSVSNGQSSRWSTAFVTGESSRVLDPNDVASLVSERDWTAFQALNGGARLTTDQDAFFLVAAGAQNKWDEQMIQQYRDWIVKNYGKDKPAARKTLSKLQGQRDQVPENRPGLVCAQIIQWPLLEFSDNNSLPVQFSNILDTPYKNWQVGTDGKISGKNFNGSKKKVGQLEQNRFFEPSQVLNWGYTDEKKDYQLSLRYTSEAWSVTNPDVPLAEGAKAADIKQQGWTNVANIKVGDVIGAISKSCGSSRQLSGFPDSVDEHDAVDQFL